MSPLTVKGGGVAALWVRRPVTGIMVFAAVALIGGFSLARLKLALMPDINFPVVAVITTYEGAGPEAVELLVTRPIEQAMASVQGVEKLTSSSQQGTSLVLAQFTWGEAMDIAEQDVRKNLEIFADGALPDDAQNPLVFAFDPSMQPVLFMSVNAPGTPDKVRRLVDDEIIPSLSRIDGVASAEVMGGTDREIQVRVHPEWLQAYEVSVAQVVTALRAASVLIPGGRIDQEELGLNISTRAEFRTVDEIREVVVGATRAGTPILLADVADVVDTFEEVTHAVRANGKPAVQIAVRKQSDANTVQVVRRVRGELVALEGRLPEGVEIVPLFDQGEPVTRSLSNLSSTAVGALFLTALVLLLFLRSFRTSTIVLVSIPLAVLATFSAMDALDVTLNMISLAGLALAVGMLVDNAIVVLENVFRLREEGYDGATAAIEGTREMSMPITASTLTTIAVFAPVLFVPGLAGQLFKDMALTICISLTASLIVALTLVPLLASLLLGRKEAGRIERFLTRITWWIDSLADVYGRALGRMLKRSKLVLFVTFLFFVGTMASGGLLEADFLPTNDFGMVEFSFKAAPGTSVAETTRLVDEIEAVVRKEIPEAEVVSSEYGEAKGFSAIFGSSASSGTVRVRLPPRGERSRPQREVEKALRDRFDEVAGVEMTSGNAAQSAIFGVGGGDVLVKVFAQDLPTLRTFGSRLKDRLASVEGAVDVNFSLEAGQPELKVELDREQIRVLGLNPAQVASVVSTYFQGVTATVFREAGEETRVFVRAPLDVRSDIAQLRMLPIMTPLGTSVPLETVARIEPGLGPSTIAHENQRRIGTIGVSGQGVPLGTLVERIEAAIDEVPKPPSVSISVGGSAEDLQESFAALALAFVAAFLLVYMVMASQFESLLEPFVILGAIPFALSGVVLGLLVTGTTLQVTALIGVILLTGVVVNNGIVLIDVLKTKRAEGMDLVEAAALAGRRRLRPILMTTLTTVLGMLPLAAGIGDGAETWAPMARSVVGGLSVSTLLTLIAVPAAYVVLAGTVDRWKAKRAARAPAGGAAPAMPALPTSPPAS